MLRGYLSAIVASRGGIGMANIGLATIQTSVSEPVVVIDEGLQPILFRSAQGTLLCQAQLPLPAYGNRDRMTHKSRLSFAKSHDGGRRWERFVTREQQNEVNIEGGMVQLADGSILALETYVVPADREGFGIGELWTSKDDLETLDGPREVVFELPRVNFSASTDDGGHPHSAARLHRSLLELPNGDLLTTMYTWFDRDRAPSAYTPSMMKTRALLIRSKDGGESWKLQSTIAADDGVGSEGFTEPVLVRLSTGALEGRLICIMRTGRDLYEAHSDDDGET